MMNGCEIWLKGLMQVVVLIEKIILLYYNTIIILLIWGLLCSIGASAKCQISTLEVKVRAPLGVGLLSSFYAGWCILR